ncbi:hypothetical protein Pmani_016859 [Petrolisthes manimaculis]|uniref:C2H2-type domain-containing protein n=1 Tax=Petrolisthes manimaculis TaxID=1843537 RepID=A0AAE1U8C5_9EUCA|nr:hypothetical protein Pmani_016859 [Petrolisthes manimaculis]
MANKEESTESLGDLEELLECVADLETEDVVYLEEYLAGDGWGGVGEDSPSSSVDPPSPLQCHSPPSCSASTLWSGWHDKEVPVPRGQGKNGEMRTLNSLPRVVRVRVEGSPSQEEAVCVSRNKSESFKIKSVRPNRGVNQPKFVSYEAFPPTKNRGSLCEVCGVRLSSREGRRRHILSRHVKERTNVCDVCGKAFIFKFALKTHQAVHASSPSHVCVCGASFKLRASYMDHIHRIHQAATTTTHVCKLCFKTFHDRHTLRIHLISVHMPKTISCLHPGCPKVFSTIGLMRSHYKYHLNQRFKCDDCGQSFSSELYMCKHRLTHLGIRPHACVDCGRTYMSVSHLNKHRRAAHSNARPYQCSVCGKCYKSRDHLTFHESNHRGEKPYKCEVCGYMTAYRNTYYAHKKKQHSSSNANNGAKSGDNINVDGKEKKSALTKAKGKGRTRRKKTVNNDNSAVVVVTSNEKRVTLPYAKDIPRQLGSQSDLPQVLMYSAEEIVTSQDRTELLQDDKTDTPDGSSMDVNGETVGIEEGTTSVNLYCVLSSEPNNSILGQPVSESLTCMPTPINNSQHSTGLVSPPAVHQIVSLDYGKLEAPTNSIQNDKLQLFHLLTDSDLTNKPGRIQEKHDSLILLSNVGKCAVPNCDTNDDSLLFFKSDANSYVGLCSQHAIIDSQDNDSLSTVKLLETEELGSHIQPNSSAEEEKLCEISVIAERNPSELLIDYSQQDLTSREQHPLVTLTVQYEETNGEGETLLQNHHHQVQQHTSPSEPLTVKFQGTNDQDNSLFTPYTNLVGKHKIAGISCGDDGGNGQGRDTCLQSSHFTTIEGEYDKDINDGCDAGSSLLQSPQVTLPIANLPVTSSSLALSHHAEKIGNCGDDGSNSRGGSSDSCSTGNFSGFVDDGSGDVGDSLLQPDPRLSTSNLPVSSSSLTPSRHTEVCLDETFSTMMELDSGVATLSGHIVDDSFNLAQLEVQCPVCDQFLCMDEYVTHLECSHN